MVSAKELRIGNFIVDDEGALSKVTGFRAFDHSIRCDEDEGCEILIDIYGADGAIRTGYVIDSNYACPLPITSKILEQCGFEYDKITYSKGPLMLAEGDNGWDIWY